MRFWRRAIERVNANDVDPVGTPPFRIDREVRIATAGSCFAQSMSRVLTRAGYRHLVTEPGPQGLPAEQARSKGYGVFSTRCGNVYTARQLLQLFVARTARSSRTKTRGSALTDATWIRSAR